MSTSTEVALAKIALVSGALPVIVLVAVAVWYLPVFRGSESTITRWENIPFESKAKVVAMMEREQDVFAASLDQTGPDIFLELHVLPQISLARAEQLAQQFMDAADQLARQFVETTDPSGLPLHNCTVRVFSRNEVLRAGEMPMPEEFTILEWKR